MAEISKQKQTKTTLFNFLNIKDVDLNNIVKPSKIITNSNINNSVFNNIISNNMSNDDRAIELDQVLETFVPIQKAKDVRSINSQLFLFGQKLSNDLTAIESDEAKLNEEVNNLTNLTPNEKNTLWDNLYYQSIKTDSKTISDAISYLLKADNLVTFCKDLILNNKELLKHDSWKDKATALLEIPHKLVVNNKIDIQKETPELGSDQKASLDKIINSDIARLQIKRCKKAIEELSKTNNQKLKEYTIQYNEALDLYNEQLAISLNDVTDQVGLQSPITPFKYASYEEPNSETIESLVSKDTFEIYTDLIEKDNNIEGIIVTLDKKLESFYDTIIDNAESNETLILYGNTPVQVNKKATDNSAIYQPLKLYKNKNLYSFIVTHFFHNTSNKSKITSAKITFGNNTLETVQAKLINESDSHVTYQLSPSGIEINDINTTIDIEADINTQIKDNKSLKSLINQIPMNDRVYKWPYLNINSYNDGLPGNNKVKMYGVTKVGIGEYKRVEQVLCCYVPGEVSHIENIMAREYKDKETRTLVKNETTTEETSEREVENLKDTTSTDRYEMQNEISKVIASNQAFQQTANFKYDGGMYSAGGDTSFSTGSSSSSTTNNSEHLAKELTERALQRIVEKTSYKRTSKMLIEHEDIYKHGFDNRKGDKHVVGIYRWVDKIYENQLVNYGKRLMYDFMVPEPSKNFKYWMTLDPKKNLNAAYLVEPIKPSVLGMNSRTDITKDTYAKFAAQYDAEVNKCPESAIVLAKGFGDTPNKSGGVDNDRVNGGYQFELPIPEGYVCKTISFSCTQTLAGQDYNKTKGYYTVGRYIKILLEDSAYSSTIIPVYDIEKFIPVTADTHDVGSFSIQVVGNCEIKSEYFGNWQSETYMKVMEAYKRKLQEYNDAMVAALSANNTSETHIDYNFNPLIGRSIEQRELKRICIELMSKPYGLNTGRNNYNPLDTINQTIKVNNDSNFESHSSQARFFEQAFDWSLISYIFYPYYWGEEKEWNHLIKESSSADTLFQAFLQAGMARVTVPVRLGFEKAVMFYLDTGNIWMGKGYVLDGLDDLYLSIEKELEVVEGHVEARWLSTVPTALTIIQTEAGPLVENGLPCGGHTHGTTEVPCPCNDYAAIGKGNNLMELPEKDCGCKEPISIDANINVAPLDEFAGTNAKCTNLQNAIDQITNSMDQTIIQFDTVPAGTVITCADALKSLRDNMTMLIALIAQGISIGCNTTDWTTKKAQLQSEIDRIQAVC